MENYSAYHLHTTHSHLDGIGKLVDYFKRAEELGIKSLGVSDHGNLHHVIDAWEVSKEFDVKLSCGIETYTARQTRWHRDELERATGKASDELSQRGPYHLSLIAQNQLGFKNLVKLSSDAYTEGFYQRPRCDNELLEKYGSGLIILSGCLAAEIPQYLLNKDFDAATDAARRFQDYVGKDNFYIEVMNHGLPEESFVLKQLVEVAKKVDAKIIPTLDSHYVYKDQAKIHDLSLCINTSSIITDEKRFKFYNDQFYLKSYEEMAAVFPAEWLQNTLDLNEKIDELNFELKQFQFPIYDYEGDHFELLRDLTYKGLKQRYGEITKELDDRAIYELDVINRMGFTDYLLIIWDIINWSRKNDILLAARGSIAGAIVGYSLNITTVDPIKYDLLFERFLIDGRISMPDIDLDVAEDRREEVINYIKVKYGINNVCQVCNFTTIGSRSAIRDAARVLGHEYAIGDRLANFIPPPIQGFARSINESFKDSQDLQNEYNNDANAKEILDAARGLEGLIRQQSVHASAILVTPGLLTDYVPIMQKPNKDSSPGPIITQWNGTQVDSQGLLKIDILGLKTYTIIDKTVKSIKKRYDIDISLSDLPLDDYKAFELLRAGDTTSLFQLGQSGISNLTYEIQPEKLEDIMAIQALYRPGPLGSNMDKMYISRRRGAKYNYTHPLLEPILKDTYGLMIYQESLLGVIGILAGYSAAERDTVRKYAAKKLPEKLKAARGEFVKRSTDFSGISEILANKIFDEIEYFGAYGFSRNHASLYSFIAFQTAYFKAHYPTEYMAAVISSQDNIEKAGEFVEAAKKISINVFAPSINQSGADCLVSDDNTILYGFNTINGIGAAALKRILNNNREYTNLYDWLRRTDIEVLNKSLIEHLLFAGALDELESEQEYKLIPREERIQLLNAEAQELGTYLTEHPLKGIWSFLQNDITHTIAQLTSLEEKTNVVVAGLIVSKEVKYTKRDKKAFIIFQLQDLTGILEVVAFSRQAEQFKDISIGDIVLMRGPISLERKLADEEEAKKVKLTLFECRIPKLPEYSLGESIELIFKNRPSPYILNKICDIIEANAGDSPVIISYGTGKMNLTYRFKKPTNMKIKEQLETMVMYEAQNN